MRFEVSIVDHVDEIPGYCHEVEAIRAGGNPIIPAPPGVKICTVKDSHDRTLPQRVSSTNAVPTWQRLVAGPNSFGILVASSIDGF
jgi:hypothetical protein